jgi:hypothetical protein
VMLNSRAVFSSGLWYAQSGGKGEVKEEEKANDSVMINIHLPASEDETLLWRRNARLLLDFLLDPGDLQRTKMSRGGQAFRNGDGVCARCRPLSPCHRD